MGLEATREKAKDKGKLLGREVVWVRPSWWKREYTMLVDDEPTAHLYFNNWHSRSVTVSGLGLYWVLDRKGFFRREVQIDDRDQDKQATPFQYNWNGCGTLLLADDDVLTMHYGLWDQNSCWENRDREAIITFARRSWWRFEMGVEFGPRAAQYPELPTLIFLGFYLRLLHEADQRRNAG